VSRSPAEASILRARLKPAEFKKLGCGWKCRGASALEGLAAAVRFDHSVRRPDL
jgi:hypothetical protein